MFSIMAGRLIIVMALVSGCSNNVVAGNVAPSTQAGAVAPGIENYGMRMHRTLKSNQYQLLGLKWPLNSGETVIKILVRPDGTVMAASVYKSSGDTAMDSFALANATAHDYGSFTRDMPAKPLYFLIPTIFNSFGEQ